MLCKIIDSTYEEYINKRINVIKSNDNSNKVNDLSCCEQYKSLPIGNMTSQFFAIYYLSGLDHFIIYNLHLKYYIRYMDDFVLIHHDKDYLKKCKNIIEEKLKNEYKLELNDKSTIYDINNGFDFLGYTYKAKNNKTIISISRKTFKNIKKHIKTYNKDINSFNMFVNYYNSFKYCNNGNGKLYLDEYFYNKIGI